MGQVQVQFVFLSLKQINQFCWTYFGHVWRIFSRQFWSSSSCGYAITNGYVHDHIACWRYIIHLIRFSIFFVTAHPLWIPRPAMASSTTQCPFNGDFFFCQCIFIFIFNAVRFASKRWTDWPVLFAAFVRQIENERTSVTFNLAGVRRK